jgi:SAM-dependent methyltransferase
MTTNPTEATYVFNATFQQERERLAAIENIWDATSIRYFEALGAGGGSLAERLCERVGATGQVIATDLDTRFLEAIDVPNLEVLRHDISADGLPAGTFDLVHCRLLLEHLPNSEAALRHMVAALKPGGRLLVEEFDHVSFLPDPDSAPADREAWDAWLDAFGEIATQRGIDLVYGRRLFSLLSKRGLTEVNAEGRTVVERGGTAGRGLLRLSIDSLRPRLIATGAMNDASVDQLRAALDNPDFSWTSQIMVSAWGTKA